MGTTHQRVTPTTTTINTTTLTTQMIKKKTRVSLRSDAAKHYPHSLLLFMKKGNVPFSFCYNSLLLFFTHTHTLRHTTTSDRAVTMRIGFNLSELIGRIYFTFNWTEPPIYRGADLYLLKPIKQLQNILG